MAIKVAKSLIHLIIVLMVFECFVAAFATPHSIDFNHTSIASKSSGSILSSALLAETEEERSEEESSKALAVELEDFTKIASFLSQIHTLQEQFILDEQRDDHQPPLFELFCVFII